MDNLMVAVNAVIPLLFYLVLGYLARWRRLASEEQFRWLNRVVFRVFFFFMMFKNSCKVDLSAMHTITWLLAVTLALYFLEIGAGLLIVPRLVRERDRIGVIIQNLFRSNSVLYAIPLAESVLGTEGVGVASMLVTFIIPLNNIISVMILEYYGDAKNRTVKKMLAEVVTNPLILGAAAGLLFSAMSLSLPKCLDTPVTKLADLSTPLALFALGGTLRFASVKNHLKYLVPSLFVKLVGYPAIVIWVAQIFRMDPVQTFSMFIIFGTPVAAASYPMTQEMGGDSTLAGEFVAIGTAVSTITIFLWILFMKTVGII